MKCLSVFIGGNGSNLEAILEAIERQALPMVCVGVISHNDHVQGIQRAKRFGVPVKIVPHASFSTRESFEAELLKETRALKPDVIALAGFMRLLSARFIEQVNVPILNIHPSLLPKYPGLHPHQQALDNHDTFTGATVHLVNEKMDDGHILAQAQVPILAEDTKESLSQRVLQIEHKLYIEVLKWIAIDRMLLDKHPIILDHHPLGPNGQLLSFSLTEKIA